MTALSVSVLGAGLMGHAIAAAFVARGIPVALFDPDPEARRMAPELVQVAVDDLNQQTPPAALSLTDDLVDAVKGADVVFEASPEQLDLKRKLVADIGAANPNAIIASNTSSFPAASLAEHAVNPGLVVVAHWWNPPHLISLVEIVSASADGTAATTLATLLRSIGKEPVHLRRDIPGFIGNRLQHALWREAFALVEAGVCDAETIDVVVRNSFGQRLGALGPMENADYVGLDLTLAIHTTLFPSLSAASTPSPLLQHAVAEGHLGKKSGQGLFVWPDGRDEEVTNRLRTRLLPGSWADPGSIVRWRSRSNLQNPG